MTELRIRDYVQVLLRHRLAMVLVVVGVVLLGVVPEALQAPTYAAKAQVRVGSETATSPFEVRTEDVDNRTIDLISELEVLRSDRMRSQVVDRLGPGAEPFDTVSVEAVSFTEVINLRVTAASPAAAADAANAYAAVFVEQRQQRSVAALVTQSEELKRRSEAAQAEVAEIDAALADPALPAPQRDSLQLSRASLSDQIRDYNLRADQLDVDASLREGATEVIQPAQQELTPVAPQPLRTGLVALVLGILAGIAVAVLLELNQDRLWSPEEFASIDGDVHLLASVPHMDDEAMASGPLPPAALEAYRYLRTSLRFMGTGTAIRAVVVTSAMSEEGKTTTAVNLARVMAEAGDRVVVLDADVRRPSVHRALGLSNDVGLTSVLAGTAPLDEAVRYVAPTLAVLGAGPPTANPNELLSSEAFARLVRSLRDQCDLLLIDAPPILPVADPLLAGRVADGTLLVARLGQVRRRDLRVVLRRLRDARLPVAGIVANDVEARLGYGDYGDYEAVAEGVERPARRAGR